MVAKKKKERDIVGVPIEAQWVKNPNSVREDVGLIPDLAQWAKDPALPQGAA